MCYYHDDCAAITCILLYSHQILILHFCCLRFTENKLPIDPFQQKTKKDISTIEDPFDAPTYHIPEKPVTFTEGASYSLIILAGLGVAGLAAYAVFKELIFEPKEYVFSLPSVSVFELVVTISNVLLCYPSPSLPG